MCVCLLKSLLSVHLGLYPGAELLRHREILYVAFWAAARLFSAETEQCSIPTSNARRLQCLHTLTDTWYRPHFDSSSPSRNDVSLWFWFPVPQGLGFALNTCPSFTHSTSLETPSKTSSQGRSLISVQPGSPSPELGSLVGSVDRENIHSVCIEDLHAAPRKNR